MIKKTIKSILTLGLLISIDCFQLRGDNQLGLVDFESYLQPHDLALLEQNESMVFITPSVINVIASITSDDQLVKDLVEHVKLGYSVATAIETSKAIQHIIELVDSNSAEYSILKKYQQSLINGDAEIKDVQLIDRRRKVGKFCTLFVTECASIGCLNVRGNLNVCGTISTCGITGFTGACGRVTFPEIVSLNNIRFNAAGTTPLNAQGAVERFLRIIRGTINIIPSLTGIILTPTAGPGTAIAVAGLPTVVTPLCSGLCLGLVAGAAFSSGIVMGVTPTGDTVYYFGVDIQIPVTFSTSYSALPTIVLTVESDKPAITTGTGVVDANSATVIQASISSVTTSSAVINVVFHITAQGPTYSDAVTNAQTAVNNLISSNAPSNALSVNIVSNGPVS